jgi:phosphatidylinositol-3-phosphatase
VALTLIAPLLVVSGCSTGSDTTTATGRATPPSSGTPTATTAPVPTATVPSDGSVPTPDHVVVVVFENKAATDVVGTGDAPYLTSLAEAGATFTDAHGETHPSQPNYLALFSGSMHGVNDNSCPLALSGPNLASQLMAAGRTFAGYAQDLPHPGFTGCKAGDYARKHNPWVNFTDLPPSVNQPLTALPNDYASLPTVSFIVPNLCNDMHDCGVATGDRWAHDNLDDYVRWAETHNSLLIVTFDEDSGSDANRIATILAGPMVRSGVSDQRIDHYSVLRTVEEMYGLEPLGRAADAAPITNVWTTSAAVPSAPSPSR